MGYYLLCLMVLVVFYVHGCSGDRPAALRSEEHAISKISDCTFDSLVTLESRLTYAEVRAILGSEYTDVGSGVAIPVFKVRQGGEAALFFGPDNRLSSVVWYATLFESPKNPEISSLDWWRKVIEETENSQTAKETSRHDPRLFLAFTKYKTRSAIHDVLQCEPLNNRESEREQYALLPGGIATIVYDSIGRATTITIIWVKTLNE